MFPETEEVDVKIEDKLDFVHVDDKSTIIGPEQKTVRLEFTKPKNKDDKNTLCYKRKLVFGSCALNDSKNEKAGNYEIIMPKDDKNGYFVCNSIKDACNAGSNKEIIFDSYNNLRTVF